MKLGAPLARTRRRTVFAAALAALAAALAGVARAADEDAVTGGRFLVHTAYTELIDGVYYLNADIEYGLSPAALAALESSLPLTVKLEIEIIRRRRFLWDATVAQFTRAYQIAYHPLSQRYLVRDFTTGETESFTNYRTAIARLGQVSDVPIIDERLLEPDAEYRVRLRAVLDLEEYAAPLRVFASFWSDWEITSDWYAWVLKSP